MPQVSLYIDNETLVKIERLAKKHGLSISKWVGDSLKKLIKDNYPDDFLKLFGAIQDESFDRPARLSLNDDTDREKI